jgi:fibronectin type 3 domain-containing protein
MRNLFFTISIILLSTCVIPLNEVSNLSNLTEEELNPPIGLTIFPYSTNSAIISWQEVENANSYSIYVSRSEFGIYELVQTINENTFVIPDLQLDIKYSFKISVSINNLGESDLSQQVAITIVDLPKPTGLTAFTVSPTTIKITWANIIEATGYKIYRSSSTSSNYTLIGSTNETNYTDNELETGTTYF